MFAGFVALGATLVGAFFVKNSQESPVNADAAPIFKVYGPNGLMQNGTGIATVLDSSLSGSYQYMIAADPANGYEVGTCYHVFITATVLGTPVGYEQSFIVT
jgi:hypothetical protein